MNWDEQFEPSLDFPKPPSGVSRRYAICSTPRCGSHLLGQLLYATGALGCPLEYFNRRNIVRWQERAAAAGTSNLVGFLTAIRTSPNGCFALKAHYPHLRTLTRHIPLNDFASTFVHVHIVRRDLLAQAISFARAEQTDDWISRGAAGERVAVYRPDLIRRCLVEIGRQNASWNYFFHAFGIQPLGIEYESLAADPAACVRRVAAFVGVEMKADAPVPAPRTSRQRDDEHDDWRSRFLDEMHHRHNDWNVLDVLRHVEPEVPRERSRWRQRVHAALGV